jgi:hypothetical protein
VEANAPQARYTGTKVLLPDYRDLHHAAFLGGAENAPAALSAPTFASS